MVHAEVEEAGAICVPAAVLRDIADRLRDLHVPVSLHDEFVEPAADRHRDRTREFSPSGDCLVVECGPAAFRLLSLAADDFPAEACQLPRPKNARLPGISCRGQHATGCAPCADARRLVRRRNVRRDIARGGCPRVAF
jgi:hypothetical protein